MSKSKVNGVPKIQPPLWIWTIWVATAVLCAATYPSLPNRLPSHWNIVGEVDAESPKLWVIGGMFLLSLAIYFGMAAFARIDPSRPNYAQFPRAFAWLRGLVALFPIVLVWLIIASALGHEINLSKSVGVMFALMFAMVGNRLGQIRHNYFLGIRTPWTLASEMVWRKTHRFAAWLWTAAGVVGLLAILTLPQGIGFVTFFVSVMVSTAVSFIYSYVVYRGIAE